MLNRLTKASYFPYIYAMAGEGLMIATGFLMLLLIQRRFGPEDLALYMIMRRAISMVIPIILIGVPLSLIKHIGETEDKTKIFRYMIVGLSVPALIGISLIVSTVLFPGKISSLLLGDEVYAGYALPLLAVALATSLILLVQAISKGAHKIIFATHFSHVCATVICFDC